MKHFTKFFENRPETFRGHNFTPNPLTMTLPDVVPTLKEIILSGTASMVGTPLYDASFEQGEARARIQAAPLEMVLAGREAPETEDDDDRRKKENDGKGATNGQDLPGDEGDGQGATPSGAE